MSAVQVIQGEGFKLCITREDGYLHARVYDGVDSQAVSIAYQKMLAEACRVSGHTRLLLVEELEASVEAADVDMVITAALEAGLGDVRIAFVELREDLAGNEYAEILCRERGMHVRTFTDELSARQWLLYGE
ncbi:hypothetical protein [Thermomonas haemolytica]|uniref:STAS/SEC14 domain-containing protein n=1 Tax=Thermomonas haemolytica TaxID=141949 RepID=A0A4R3NB34_9GAMM|nr:hypothetical protein [Thermomonas haemolytica]TCT26014.1 hypothetical protein EDC34_101341 [Thermomonas haemolytica]TNY28998.1 hypothetical protein BV505_07170 [Thermomonas haemolytica]